MSSTRSRKSVESNAQVTRSKANGNNSTNDIDERPLKRARTEEHEGTEGDDNVTKVLDKSLHVVDDVDEDEVVEEKKDQPRATDLYLDTVRRITRSKITDLIFI